MRRNGDYDRKWQEKNVLKLRQSGLNVKFFALALLSALSACLCAAQQPDANALVRRIDAANQARYDHVLAYTVTEHYTVVRGNDPAHPAAEMTVFTAYHKATGKSCTIQSQSGSSIILRFGLRPLLDNEKAINNPATVQNSWFSSANYNMKLKPEPRQRIGGRDCVALEITPKRKAPNMVKGTLWIDPRRRHDRTGGRLRVQEAEWLTRIRYGVIIGQVVLILVAEFLSRIELPLGWLAIPLAVMIGSNYLLGWLSRKTNARRTLGLSLAIDIVALTAVLALSGGPANPFTLLFLVQITLSAVVLSKEWTWFLGVLSILGFGFLFISHVTLPVLEGHHAAQGFSAHLFGMWIAFVAAALLVTVLIGRVSEALRTHELEVLRLQDQLNRQEKVTSTATLAAGAAHELSRRYLCTGASGAWLRRGEQLLDSRD